MATRRTGRSAFTSYKDAHVPVLGMKVLATGHNVITRHRWFPQLVVVDLTAGPGVALDGRRSLVVTLLDRAGEVGLPVLAYLCERDRAEYALLAAHVEHRYQTAPTLQVTTYRGDCHAQLPLIQRDLDARLQAASQPRQHVCGLILVDACGFEPWAAARALAAAYPVLDVLIWVNAATIKWHQQSKGVPSLAEELDAFGKKHRFTGRPMGNFQWAVNLLSDFNYGRSVGHELEPVESALGQAWALRTDYTREERALLTQLSLGLTGDGDADTGGRDNGAGPDL